MAESFNNPYFNAPPKNQQEPQTTNPEDCIIRSLVKPTIQVDDMVLEDAFKGTSPTLKDQQGVSSGIQVQNELGTQYPFISINAVTFNAGDIFEFSIDSTGFIPKLRLVVILDATKTSFKFNSMPKDGDLVNVFIRAKNDVFKPIRNDYLITSVDISPGSREGQGGEVTIYGELFVPHLYDEVLKSYSGTTFDVLQKIAVDMGLGFATNEKFTNDSQRWICPSDNMNNFINSTVNKSRYWT
jgi:hypothetical protein